jgi:hypothetical protein
MNVLLMNFFLKETLSNYSPEDILDSNKDWCITTSYDAYFSVIACNNKYADRFRGQQNTEIYELFL